MNVSVGNNRTDKLPKEEIMHRTATRFGLIVIVALLAVAKVAAQ